MMITSTGDINQEYKVIGYVESDSGLIGLQEIAAQMNADGVINIRRDSYTYREGQSSGGMGFYTVHIVNTYYGTAVKLIGKKNTEDMTFSNHKKIGRVSGVDDVDFSIDVQANSSVLKTKLTIKNNGNKKVKALSINLKLINVFDEEYTCDNLHYYFDSSQFKGEEYTAYSEAKVSFVKDDFVQSFDRTEIEINKIVYDEEIMSRDQFEDKRVKEAKEKIVAVYGSKLDAINAFFLRASGCRSIMEITALIDDDILQIEGFPALKDYLEMESMYGNLNTNCRAVSNDLKINFWKTFIDDNNLDVDYFELLSIIDSIQARIQ